MIKIDLSQVPVAAQAATRARLRWSLYMAAKRVSFARHVPLNVTDAATGATATVDSAASVRGAAQ